ncbi:hypothetical protein A2U01_0097570, partial [Trifolium medium]|nr:hypothetical protein [Trifolium medium]
VEEDGFQGRREFSVARVTNEEQKSVLGFKSCNHAGLTLFHAGRSGQGSPAYILLHLRRA